MVSCSSSAYSLFSDAHDVCHMCSVCSDDDVLSCASFDTMARFLTEKDNENPSIRAVQHYLYHIVILKLQCVQSPLILSLQTASAVSAYHHWPPQSCCKPTGDLVLCWHSIRELVGSQGGLLPQATVTGPCRGTSSHSCRSLQQREAAVPNSAVVKALSEEHSQKVHS